MSVSDETQLSMYTPKEIGQAIKKRRRELKITQKEFAQRLDKSERTIQKYESGEITMKIDLIKQVADELDIPWQDLLEAKSSVISIEEVPDGSPDYRFSSMADIIKALFAMTKVGDISFQLSYTKPPENPDWTSSITVNGKGNRLYDADFCLFIENWMNKLAALQNGTLSQGKFETWQRETLAYYSDSYFSDPILQNTKSQKEKRIKKKKSELRKYQLIHTDTDSNPDQDEN